MCAQRQDPNPMFVPHFMIDQKSLCIAAILDVGINNMIIIGRLSPCCDESYLYDNEMNALWVKALVALQPAGCSDPEENEMRLDSH